MISACSAGAKVKSQILNIYPQIKFSAFNRRNKVEENIDKIKK